MKTLFFAFIGLLPLACVTKQDLRRDQEITRLKGEVTSTRTQTANYEGSIEELKLELSKLNNSLDQQALEVENVKSTLIAISTRIDTLEKTRTISEDRSPEMEAPSFALGKKYFDQGNYSQAMQILKTVVDTRPNTDDARNAQFLLAETYFANKDYALAALEYSQYKKSFPNDKLVPRAIFRQATCFQKMGKKKEAKLFFQELVDTYPAHSLAPQAKKEILSLN